jgi:hypothetical protein
MAKRPYTLDIRIPVNGHISKATVLALDSDERVLDTGRADLLDAKERDKLSQRMAPKVGDEPAAFQEQLEAKWNETLTEHRRTQEEPEVVAPTQSQVLIDLAEGAELFHTPDAEPFATITVADHAETWPLRSKGFRRWLAAQFYALQGKAPGGQAYQDAFSVLEGKAVNEGMERPVHVRLAELDGQIYLDLADPAWRAIEIDAKGWRVVKEPPVRFRRPKGLLPLPEPVRGGTLDELRPFVNLPSADDADATDAPWRVLICWLTAAMRPRGPYPLLVLTGEPGAAKSTLGRILRSLFDPSVTPLRSQPREQRDLMIAATSGWLVALDNLSCLSEWLSDALCRLATGGGFATRQLYADAEEVLFDAMRPALLTSIDDVVTAGDLLDRTVFLRLETIPEERRQTEAELYRKWETARPRVLGALLDAVNGGLRQLPSVRLSSLPRMADFGLWCEAVGRGLGWRADSTLAAYRILIGDAAQVALEASVIAGPLQQLLERNPRWEGTATDLLRELATLAGDKAKSKDWPARPNVLSGHLGRLAPNLRRLGIWVTFRKAGRARSRTILLESRCETSSASSASSAPGENPGKTQSARGRSADDGGRSPAQASSASNAGKTQSADDADDADAPEPPCSNLGGPDEDEGGWPDPDWEAEMDAPDEEPTDDNEVPF